MSMQRLLAAVLSAASYAKRFVAATVAAGVCFSSVVSVPAAAEQRFQPYSGTARVDTSRVAGLRAAQNVKVVVVMSEDSIATARAKSATHTVSLSERASIEQRVAAQHESIRPGIEARGGKVLAKFHSALNGVKIDIHPSQIAALSAMPGVVKVLPVGKFHVDNVVSVPYIGAPTVWSSGEHHLRGEHIKIAIIDTGIDYTHANFGGPGTKAAFAAAAATSTAPADPTMFGPDAPKVKGGYDFVGDAYNANIPTSVPVPDPNPLDCFGHGSHVAGTAAGFGVTAAGATYQGPYNSSIYANPDNFTIGPGVAPKADLYALRVFGCAGSTNVVVEAIDWAVQHDMDVISMSLGSDYGPSDTADALASDNAAKAGITVVAAAGNAGPAPYILGDPASGDSVIAAAATDAHASFAGATVTEGSSSVTTQDSNGAALPTTALPVVVLPDTKGTGSNGISLGCDPTEYTAAGVTGKLVIVVRGTCDRVLRPIYGQQAGAAAVLMINNGAGYPPFEGHITGDPTTGPYTVTIPFLGAQPTDEAALKADAAGSATLAATTIPNPGFQVAAGFSSGGPRFGDSMLKPGVTAPGVAVVSTLIGSGNGATTESGTSMATPHVSGVAALTRQAHPSWSELQRRAAIVETADPGKFTDYDPRVEGQGLVQPVGATRTHAVVLATDNPTGDTASFGFAEFTRDFSSSQSLEVSNDGEDPVTFNITSTAAAGGAPHAVSVSPSTVTVGRGSNASVRVTLSVPAATVGSTHDALGNDLFTEVGGFVTFTPADREMNNGVSLRVPYFLVPRARSQVRASSGELHHGQGVAHLSNQGGAITGNGDFYAWGLSGTRQGVRAFDVRAVGVQSNPVSATDSVLVFAINTFDRFSNPAMGEFDILIDTTGSGTPNYDLVAADLGQLTTGNPNGLMVVALFNLVTGAGSINFLADAPTDGSIALLPVFASSLGLSPSSSKFTYFVQFFNQFYGTAGQVPGTASFDVFNPAISTAMFVPVAPGTSLDVPFQVFPSIEQTPTRGLMVVTQDNHSGGAQANLLPIELDN